MSFLDFTSHNNFFSILFVKFSVFSLFSLSKSNNSLSNSLFLKKTMLSFSHSFITKTTQTAAAVAIVPNLVSSLRFVSSSQNQKPRQRQWYENSLLKYCSKMDDDEVPKYMVLPILQNAQSPTLIKRAATYYEHSADCGESWTNDLDSKEMAEALMSALPHTTNSKTSLDAVLNAANTCANESSLAKRAFASPEAINTILDSILKRPGTLNYVCPSNLLLTICDRPSYARCLLRHDKIVPVISKLIKLSAKSSHAVDRTRTCMLLKKLYEADKSTFKKLFCNTDFRKTFKRLENRSNDFPFVIKIIDTQIKRQKRAALKAAREERKKKQQEQQEENDETDNDDDANEDEDDDARQKTAIKTRKNNNNKSGDQASAEYGKVRLFGSIGWGIAAPMQVALMSFLYNSNTNPSSATTTSPDMKAWFPDRVVVGGGGGGQQNSSSSPKTPMFGTIIIFILATMGFTAAIKLVPSSSSNMISRNNVEYSTRSSVHDDESENDDDDERDRLVEVADVNRSTTTTPSNDDHELQSVATTKSATTTSKAENDEETSKMKPAVLKNNNKKRTEQLLSLIWSLRSVLLLAVLYGICDDSLSTFLFPFLRSDLNVPSKILGIIPTVNVLSELPVLYLTGWFNKKFSIYALHALYLFLWVVRFSWYSFVLVPNDDGNKNSTSAVVSTTSTTVVPSSIINSPISTNVAETNEQGWIPSYSPELHHQLVSSFKILSIETLNGLCFAGAFVLLMRHTVTLSSSTSDSNSKKSDDEQSNRQHEDSSTGDDKNYKNNDEDNVHQTIPLVHSAFFGVASMIVGLGGGGLAQRFGVRMLFSLEALICFLVALMILCVVVWRKAG